MAKKILSIEYEIPGGEVENLSFRSNRSLLDADIVLFHPEMSYYSRETYAGKPLLDEGDSFIFTKAIEHWRTELKIAIQARKTVIIFLPELDELYVHTGQKQFSGTGRNRLTTNLVSPASNYDTIPVEIGSVVPKNGTGIKTKGTLGVLAHYWREFASYSPYNVYFQNPIDGTCLVTKTGEKTIAIAVPNSSLLLLPTLQYPDDFIEDEDENDEGETVIVWSSEAIQFGKRFVSILLEIDHMLHEENEVSLAPEWCQEVDFVLINEMNLLQQIPIVNKEIEALALKRSQIISQANTEGKLRRLLYEQGHPLESAIIEALQLMGFKAENIIEGDSEFDVVFVSPEGRFLGEAEGKDSRPINIDKFSQLERNIHEDFAREDIIQHAKGVLFGNAFRFEHPSKRAQFFTEKCLSAAKRTGIALVRTPDLFEVARYLKENVDRSFAQKCREAIANTSGEIVQFPEVPESIFDKLSKDSSECTDHIESLGE